jgi:hypothetical protein
VPCGSATCTGDASTCCHDYPANGGDGGPGGCADPQPYCPGTGPAAGGAAIQQQCDGPEDCPPGQGCCAEPGAFCAPPGYCIPSVGDAGAKLVGGYVVCHGNADCPAQAPICGEPTSFSGPGWGPPPGTQTSPPYLVRLCTRPCASDTECANAADAGAGIPYVGQSCYADNSGCGPTCHVNPLPTDGGLDGGLDAGPLPDGCVTPYTPGFALCSGQTAECNMQFQYCCSAGGTTDTCLPIGISGNCGARSNCDGPEDCPAGQVCWAPGAYCVATACGAPSSDLTCSQYGGGSCFCHSDADCPGAYPYCYSIPCSWMPTCNSRPPPPDAGVVYGTCTIDAGPAGNYAVACGSTTCTSQSDQCCIAGTSSACQPRSSSCSGVPVQCDGPEDCPAGYECCWGEPGAISASTAQFCTQTCPGRDVVCHTAADCPASNPTCVPRDGGPSSYCQ